MFGCQENSIMMSKSNQRENQIFKQSNLTVKSRLFTEKKVANNILLTRKIFRNTTMNIRQIIVAHILPMHKLIVHFALVHKASKLVNPKNTSLLYNIFLGILSILNNHTYIYLA